MLGTVWAQGCNSPCDSWSPTFWGEGDRRAPFMLQCGQLILCEDSYSAVCALSVLATRTWIVQIYFPCWVWKFLEPDLPVQILKLIFLFLSHCACVSFCTAWRICQIALTVWMERANLYLQFSPSCSLRDMKQIFVTF
jgi:hypothetical protein